MRQLKYVIFFISFILNNQILAEKNSNPATSGESEFAEINSVPLKINESARYSFADIVEPLIPAVVNISTIEYIDKKSESLDKENLRDKNPLDWINGFLERLNIPLNLEEIDSTPKSVPLGSGFIIDPSGLIVTNYHVITNVNKITVKLADNTELSAKLIGSDTKTDLALLKVEFPDPLPFVKFGDSNKARVGDWILAIGNPFGNLGGTVTTGIISSKGRDIDIDTDNIVDNFIQTDAAINNGNSGGPMFNLEQEVIGVNTAIFSPLGTNIGIGFAIPSNTAKPIIERLKKDGKINRGRLGVVIQDLTDEIAAGLELTDTNGVIVAKVQEDGPGDKAGIKPGDVIIEFAGQAIKNTRKLRVIVAETPIDQEVKIKVIRGGKILELTGKVTIDIEEIKKEKKVTNDEKAIEKEVENNSSIIRNNVTFSNLTDKLKEKFAIPKDKSGVIITDINEEQQEIDLKVGDLILSVNQQNIIDINELKKLYEDAKNAKKSSILLLVERASTSMFIPLLVN
ncbi:Do family serine endopeptidase [Rickettsia endosymbiont of Halotydeus destructor]